MKNYTSAWLLLCSFLALLLPAPKAEAGYQLSGFTFGCAADASSNYQGCSPAATLIAGPWVLDGWQSHHTSWIKSFQNKSQIPYVYLYVVAGQARRDWGLQDCNVGASKTLCKEGAKYLRQNSTQISKTYQSIAQSIKKDFGTTKPVFIHMEPDFYQYHHSTEQANPLSVSEAQNIMNLWVTSIKSVLPNAVMVLDVSPWNSNLEGWSRGFKGFDYAGMVGKRFAANGDGSVPNGIDGKTYKQMSAMTGKKLILNTAYGPGGGLMDFDYSWTVESTIQDRLKDGVIAIIQPDKNRDYYTSTINKLSKTSPPPSTSGTAPQPTTPTTPTPTSSGSAGGGSIKLRPTLNIESDWNTGFCSKIRIYNDSSKTIQNWSLKFSMTGAKINNSWSGKFSSAGSSYTVTPAWQGDSIAPKQFKEVGFCANKLSDNYKPSDLQASGQ